MTTREWRAASFWGAVAVLAATIALTSSSGAFARDEVKADSRVERGLAISPVRLDLRGRDRALVGLGSYIVNAQCGCSDCHTSPSYAAGGNPFQGEQRAVPPNAYFGGGVSFGSITSRNLTPNGAGETLGGRSFDGFRTLMRTGIDPERRHPMFGPYLQAMPWPAYREMSDEDLRAIYEFLAAVPCVEGGPGEPPDRCRM